MYQNPSFLSVLFRESSRIRNKMIVSCWMRIAVEICENVSADYFASKSFSVVFIYDYYTSNHLSIDWELSPSINAARRFVPWTVHPIPFLMHFFSGLRNDTVKWNAASCWGAGREVNLLPSFDHFIWEIRSEEGLCISQNGFDAIMRDRRGRAECAALQHVCIYSLPQEENVMQHANHLSAVLETVCIKSVTCHSQQRCFC